VEVVASLSQGRTAAAQCGLFTYKSVPVTFEPPFKFTKLVAEFQQNVNYTSHNFPLELATDGLHITQFCTRADQKVNCTLIYKI